MRSSQGDLLDVPSPGFDYPFVCDSGKVRLDFSAKQNLIDVTHVQHLDYSAQIGLATVPFCLLIIIRKWTARKARPTCCFDRATLPSRRFPIHTQSSPCP
jgi:hypothetical protein